VLREEVEEGVYDTIERHARRRGSMRSCGRSAVGPEADTFGE
jgi:hypothetical protein